jgi:photosystem II stability/assembly factor-like uncharacterized protein
MPPLERPFLPLLAALALAAPVSATASAQWVAQPSPTEVELRGLDLVSPRVAWASGMRGTVIRSVDGGQHWTRDTVPGAGALDLRAVAATSPLVAHAMAIADSSAIYRTTDGGASWTRRWVATRKGTFLDAVQFWDARHGIAMSDPVDGRFLVIITSDGGETWAEIPAERIPPALAGEGGFAASGTCLTVFGDSHVWLASGGASVARVYHSPDRGRTWTVHDTPIRAGVPSAGIFSVAFRDARHGVIAGGDYRQPTLRGRNLAVTADGGATWTLADSTASPAGYRSAVAYVPGTNGRSLVAVGLSGTDVSHDGGRTWTQVDTVGYNSVAFASKRAGVAVGPKGKVALWKGGRGLPSRRSEASVGTSVPSP